MKVPLSDIVGQLEVEALDLGEDEILIDAFVIVRTVRPDREHPITAFTTTLGMDDSIVRLGALLMVLDKLRADAGGGWSDEE